MHIEIKNKILDKNHHWNFRWLKSIFAPARSHSLSPNGRWLILEYAFHQDPEDRYESEIDDEEYILFDLENDDPESEIGRFFYYYNYNSSADWKEIAGTRFEWGEGNSNLILGETIMELDNLTTQEIREKLGKLNTLH